MINLRSPGPLGLGELPNQSNGNSILTLKTKTGSDINYALWINDFSTDLNMQIDMSQLKAGYTYRPIRIQERILSFTTIWSLANRPKYEELVQAIRDHWAYNLNENVPTPMYFTYFGANKTFMGYILGAQRSYAVPDTLLSFTFEMKLLNSNGNDNSATVINYSYYVPRASDVQLSGLDLWYSKQELTDPQLGVNEIKPDNQNINTNPGLNSFTAQREGGFYWNAYTTANNDASTNSRNIRPPDSRDTSIIPTYEANRAAGIAWTLYFNPSMTLEEAIFQVESTLRNNDLSFGPLPDWVAGCENHDPPIPYMQYVNA